MASSSPRVPEILPTHVNRVEGMLSCLACVREEEAEELVRLTKGGNLGSKNSPFKNNTALENLVNFGSRGVLSDLDGVEVRVLMNNEWYKPGKKQIGKKLMGRLYGCNSTQNLMGSVRRYVFDNIATDTDIKNAQPTLLVQTLLRNGYKGPTERLRAYVENRDGVLEMLRDSVQYFEEDKSDDKISRDEAKEIMLQAMYGGHTDYWLQKRGARMLPRALEGMKAFETEMELAAAFIVAHKGPLVTFPSWPEVLVAGTPDPEATEEDMEPCPELEDVEPWDSEMEPWDEEMEPPGLVPMPADGMFPCDPRSARKKLFSQFSILMQDLERQVMFKAIEAIIRGGGRIFTMIHDGVYMRFGYGLVQGNQLAPPEQDPETAKLTWAGKAVGMGPIAIDKESLEIAVELLTGFTLEFKVEPVKADLSLPALLAKVLEPAFQAMEAEEEEEAAPMPAVVYEESKNKDMPVLDCFLAHYKGKLGRDGDGTLWHFCTPHYSEAQQGLWKPGLPPHAWWQELMPGSIYADDGNRVASMSKLLLAHRFMEDPITEWEKYGADEFPMLSGLLNLRTGEMRPYEPGDYANRKVDFDLDPDVDEEALGWVYNHNADFYGGDAALERSIECWFAYGCFVRGNPLKQALNPIGQSGNNGKSALGIRIKAGLGKRFAGALDASVFTGRPASGAANPQLHNAAGLNVVLVEEPNGGFEGNAFKEWTGGTELNVRTLYQKGSGSVRNNMFLIFNSNAPIIFKKTDLACEARLLRFEMPCKFFSSQAELEQALEEKKAEPFEYASALQLYKLGDPDFSKVVSELRYRKAYLWTLKVRYNDLFDSNGKMSVPEMPEAYRYTVTALEAEDSTTEVYERLFEETGEATDVLVLKDMLETFKKAKVEIGASELGKFMDKRAKNQRKVLKMNRATIKGSKVTRYGGVVIKAGQENQGGFNVCAYNPHTGFF